MFAKPYKVKSSSVARGSERKRLKTLMLDRWPWGTEEQINSIFQPKSVIHVKQIVTCSEEFLVVHVVDGLPILMEMKQAYYPTLYALWKAPKILRYFTTWPAVFDRIKNGADLMLPGIIVDKKKGLKRYGNVSKGQIVAINTSENMSAIAVGITLMSSNDMINAEGQGKAVKILHFYGDYLYQSANQKVKVPESGPPDSLSDEPMEMLQAPYPPPPPPGLVEIQTEEAERKMREMMLQTEEERKEEEVNSEQAMDDLVKYSFLKALKTSAYKLDLPILCSSFYKLHMIPACPEGKEIDIKKSSYKKLSKFLAAMQQEGLLTVKATAKGVDSIVHIDEAHPLILAPVHGVEEVAKADSGCNRIDRVFHELLSVTAPVLPIFAPSGFRKGDSLDKRQVRDAIREYVKKNRLQDPEEKNFVKLDDVLRSFVHDQYTSAIAWQDLMDLVIGKMSDAFKMTLTGEMSVAQKGKLEPIDMQISRRAANKKVTLINNLELYGIDINVFSKECQHGSAASTSISSIPGKKSKQLLVQGNQIIFVYNLLVDKYKIPKRYIRGLELAPKKKK